MTITPLAPAIGPASTVLLAVTKVLWPKGLNTSIYLDLNNFSRHTAWAHGFMHAYALWLGLVVLTVLFVIGYGAIWWRRALHPAAVMALSGAGTVAALGINQIVGHAAAELRPYDTYTHALVLVAKANDYAFPSDHAVVAGGLITSVFLAARATNLYRSPAGAPTATQRAVPVLIGVGTCSIVFGLFLCFARVYVGAHYPGDVVAGLLLGATTVVAFSVLRPLVYWLADLVATTPLRLVLSRPEPRAVPSASISVQDVLPK
ncbi:MAG: phosphatase PAP2 family protein [Actinomycetota bacterium]|jgi:undecaprenyl-diphosphatase|nr:phosphatase PAP2 family protein [Actinomycetota bacterium]